MLVCRLLRADGVGRRAGRRRRPERISAHPERKPGAAELRGWRLHHLVRPQPKGSGPRSRCDPRPGVRRELPDSVAEALNALCILWLCVTLLFAASLLAGWAHFQQRHCLLPAPVALRPGAKGRPQPDRGRLGQILQPAVRLRPRLGPYHGGRLDATSWCGQHLAAERPSPGAKPDAQLDQRGRKMMTLSRFGHAILLSRKASPPDLRRGADEAGAAGQCAGLLYALDGRELGMESQEHHLPQQ